MGKQKEEAGGAERRTGTRGGIGDELLTEICKLREMETNEALGLRR